MASHPILFAAREPDETLRTFLPVIAELRHRGRTCLVLFQHEPGAWPRERLAEIGAPYVRLQLPDRCSIGGPLGRLGLGEAAGELRQLVQVRRLARSLLRRIDPSVVVVIQDTLLLERFLVRGANRRGLGTLVVQWAFTYPQATYDLLHRVKKERQSAAPPNQRHRGELAGNGSWRGQIYSAAQSILGVRFDLVNSYGGGEARVFAVMGEAFRDQFLAQGVHKERIEVTGHPLHDSAFVQHGDQTPERLGAIRARYGLPARQRVILYATQPVLWRAVVTRDELAQNVRALGRAVAELGPEFLLLLKLHPRESLDDYAAAIEPGLPIRLLKDAEVAELIAICEAFISSSSSTVLLAMMLDRPIVTVNFNQVPHFDYYETVGGTLHTRTPAEAARALGLALLDQPTRERLAGERAGVLSRYARFDGRATERLADLVESLISGARS